MRFVGVVVAVYLVFASSLLAEEWGYRDFDEEDGVEAFIRRQNEVEAAKMLAQAKRFQSEGTKMAAEFMYCEIIRRYPDTPQALEAKELLGPEGMERLRKRELERQEKGTVERLGKLLPPGGLPFPDAGMDEKDSNKSAPPLFWDSFILPAPLTPAPWHQGKNDLPGKKPPIDRPHEPKVFRQPYNADEWQPHGRDAPPKVSPIPGDLNKC